jgi:hypothetical protein
MIFENASVPITSACRNCAGAVSIIPLATFRREDEAAADRVHVERGAPSPADAQLLLNQAGGRRLRLIGRRARDHDQIDGRRVDAGVGQAATGGLAPHVAGRLVRSRQAPFDDAGPGDDPIV